MALTQYCSYEEVRAALGVNSDELADAVLALPVYEIGLARELKKLSPSLPAAFSVAYGLPAPRPAPAQALVDAARMFSTYAVARQVGVSLPTFAPKDVGDGKATLSRFSGAPYEATMEQVREVLADAREALLEALAEYEGAAPPLEAELPTFFTASSRLVDPVTGS